MRHVLSYCIIHTADRTARSRKRTRPLPSVDWVALTPHSLRVGGASALYHATGGNAPVVKRLGRWASEAYEGYIWEDRTLTKGLAGAMLAAPWHVHHGAM